MALDNIPTLGPGSLNSNLDKVLVYKNGGSEVAVSLLTLTNSALNPSGIYLDSTNQRVGVNNPTPAYPLDVNGFIRATRFVHDIDFTTIISGLNFSIYQGGGTVQYNGISQFNNVLAVGNIAGARLAVKGSGSTSATTSLLVQNSSGNTIFSVRDDGRITLNTENAVFGPNGPTIDGSNCIIYRGGYNTESIAFNLSRLNFTDSNGFVFSSSSYSATLTASSIVDIQSTTKGFLKPRLTTAQKNAIVTPTAGLEIYDTDLNRPCFYNGTSWITL